MPERAQPELPAALLSSQEFQRELDPLAEAGVGKTSSPVPSTRDGSGAIKNNNNKEALDEGDPQE